MLEQSIVLRKACLDDINFLVETIWEAEKSNSDKCGFANFFGLSEIEAKHYITEMLEEEIDGCEFSVDSFMLAIKNGVPVAAAGGWIEGDNSSNQSSSILKANLIGFILPNENIDISIQNSSLAEGLQIVRTLGTLQIEYVYCKPEVRGQGITKTLLKELMKSHKGKDVEIQVYGENFSAIALYEALGFKILKKSESRNPETIQIFPSNIKCLMKKYANESSRNC